MQHGQMAVGGPSNQQRPELLQTYSDLESFSIRRSKERRRSRSRSKDSTKRSRSVTSHRSSNDSLDQPDFGTFTLLTHRDKKRWITKSLTSLSSKSSSLEKLDTFNEEDEEDVNSTPSKTSLPRTKSTPSLAKPSQKVHITTRVNSSARIRIGATKKEDSTPVKATPVEQRSQRISIVRPKSQEVISPEHIVPSTVFDQFTVGVNFKVTKLDIGKLNKSFKETRRLSTASIRSDTSLLDESKESVDKAAKLKNSCEDLLNNIDSVKKETEKPPLDDHKYFVAKSTEESENSTLLTQFKRSRRVIRILYSSKAFKDNIFEKAIEVLKDFLKQLIIDDHAHNLRKIQTYTKGEFASEDLIMYRQQLASQGLSMERHSSMPEMTREEFLEKSSKSKSPKRSSSLTRNNSLSRLSDGTKKRVLKTKVSNRLLQGTAASQRKQKNKIPYVPLAKKQDLEWTDRKLRNVDSGYTTQTYVSYSDAEKPRGYISTDSEIEDRHERYEWRRSRSPSPEAKFNKRAPSADARLGSSSPDASKRSSSPHRAINDHPKAIHGYPDDQKGLYKPLTDDKNKAPILYYSTAATEETTSESKQISYYSSEQENSFQKQFDSSFTVYKDGKAVQDDDKSKTLNFVKNESLFSYYNDAKEVDTTATSLSSLSRRSVTTLSAGTFDSNTFKYIYTIDAELSYKEYNKLLSIINLLQDQKRKWEDEVQEVREKLEKTGKEKMQLAHNNHILRQSLDAANGSIKEINGKVMELKNTLVPLREDNTKLLKDIEKVQNEKRKLKKETLDLKRVVEFSKNETLVMTNEVHELRQLRSESEQKMQSNEKENETYKNTMHDKFKNLEDAYRNYCKDVEKKMTALNSEMADLKIANDTLKCQVNDKDSKLVHYESRHDELSKLNSKLHLEIKEINERHEQSLHLTNSESQAIVETTRIYKQQIEEVEIEIRRIREQLSTTKTECQLAVGEGGQLKSEVIHLQSMVKELEEQKQRDGDQRLFEQQQKEVLKDEVRDLQRQIAELTLTIQQRDSVYDDKRVVEEEISVLKMQLVEMEKLRTDCQLYLEEKQLLQTKYDEVTAKRDELSRITAQMEETRMEVDEQKRSEMEELRRSESNERERLRAEIDRLREQTVVLDQEQHHSNTLNKELESELEHLRQEIRDLTVVNRANMATQTEEAYGKVSTKILTKVVPKPETIEREVLTEKVVRVCEDKPEEFYEQSQIRHQTSSVRHNVNKTVQSQVEETTYMSQRVNEDVLSSINQIPLTEAARPKPIPDNTQAIKAPSNDVQSTKMNRHQIRQPDEEDTLRKTQSIEEQTSELLGVWENEIQKEQKEKAHREEVSKSGTSWSNKTPDANTLRRRQESETADRDNGNDPKVHRRKEDDHQERRGRSPVRRQHVSKHQQQQNIVRQQENVVKQQEHVVKQHSEDTSKHQQHPIKQQQRQQVVSKQLHETNTVKRSKSKQKESELQKRRLASQERRKQRIGFEDGSSSEEREKTISRRTKSKETMNHHIHLPQQPGIDSQQQDPKFLTEAMKSRQNTAIAHKSSKISASSQKQIHQRQQVRQQLIDGIRSSSQSINKIHHRHDPPISQQQREKSGERARSTESGRMRTPEKKVEVIAANESHHHQQQRVIADNPPRHLRQSKHNTASVERSASLKHTNEELKAYKQSRTASTGDVQHASVTPQMKIRQTGDGDIKLVLKPTEVNSQHQRHHSSDYQQSNQQLSSRQSNHVQKSSVSSSKVFNNQSSISNQIVNNNHSSNNNHVNRQSSNNQAAINNQSAMKNQVNQAAINSSGTTSSHQMQHQSNSYTVTSRTTKTVQNSQQQNSKVNSQQQSNHQQQPNTMKVISVEGRRDEYATVSKKKMSAQEERMEKARLKMLGKSGGKGGSIESQQTVAGAGVITKSGRPVNHRDELTYSEVKGDAGCDDKGYSYSRQTEASSSYQQNQGFLRSYSQENRGFLEETVRQNGQQVSSRSATLQRRMTSGQRAGSTGMIDHHTNSHSFRDMKLSETRRHESNLTNNAYISNDSLGGHSQITYTTLGDNADNFDDFATQLDNDINDSRHNYGKNYRHAGENYRNQGENFRHVNENFSENYRHESESYGGKRRDDDFDESEILRRARNIPKGHSKFRCEKCRDLNRSNRTDEVHYCWERYYPISASTPAQSVMSLTKV